MNIPRRRTRVPNSGVTRRLFLPITPKPDRWAESLRKVPPYSNRSSSENAFITSSSSIHIWSFLDCALKIPLPAVRPFLVYRALRNALEAGDIFCRNSVRYRSFEDDFLDDVRWQKKEELITETGLVVLQQPIEELLVSLERQLEPLLVEVNQRIAISENKHIKMKPGGRWTLPYTRAAPAINHSFFASHPDIDVQAVMRFVDQGTRFTQRFDHVVHRAVKQPLD